MTTFTVGIICVIAMFVLIFLRVPIAISMAVPGILGAAYIRDWEAVGSVLNTVVWGQSASYMFSTIPMFIFMGELLFASRITTELSRFIKKNIYWFTGGLGITTIGASAVFAATSGSSIASTGTMGLIAIKEMRKAGYNNQLSSGAVVAGGTLGIESTKYSVHYIRFDRIIINRSIINCRYCSRYYFDIVVYAYNLYLYTH